MLQLNTLIATTRRRKRVGRGCHRGGHSGRGNDGQKCRPGAGSEISALFEGGQMPLARRLPRRGFVSIFKKEYIVLSLAMLEKSFPAGAVVTVAGLHEAGLIKGKKPLVKILGNGGLSKALTIHVHAWSKSAQAAIEKVGGTISEVKESSSGNTAA